MKEEVTNKDLYDLLNAFVKGHPTLVSKEITDVMELLKEEEE